jgi:Protein of unknown function (DUF3574)
VENKKNIQMKRYLITIWMACISFVISSCSFQGRYTQTELYFGLSQKNDRLISDSSWNAFIKEYAGKTFANGFTIVSSEGRWVDMSLKKMYAEPSRVVISVNHMNQQLSTKIDSLISCYKKIFEQEAVLRIDKKVKVSF